MSVYVPNAGNFRAMIHDLLLYLDLEGIIRYCGCLLHTNASFDTKLPVFLSPKAHISKLIVMKIHACSLHAGVVDTLVAIRRDFWLPKRRQTVQSVVHKCFHCKRVVGCPYWYPGSLLLPVERVILSCPFAVMGVRLYW